MNKMNALQQPEHQPDQSDLPLLIDKEEAAKLLGLKVSRIQRAVFRREIPFKKIGALVRFSPSELQAWIVSDQTKPKARR